MTIMLTVPDQREYYQLCLGIVPSSYPANPYQLLDIPELETNWAKIRSACERQRAILESNQGKVPEEVWSQIRDELERAIATVNNQDDKAVLDATIRRRRAKSNPVAVATGPVPELPAGSMIECRHCQRSNQGNRRFCAGCGKSLWERCPSCQQEVTVEERFCGHCGTNITTAEVARDSEISGKIALAEKFAEMDKFDQATALLREVAMIEDPKLDQYAERAVQLIHQYETEQRKTSVNADSNYQKALKYYESKSFENALAVLDDIPPSVRTPKIEELRSSALIARNEILALGGEIREAVATKKVSGLLPKIERLLSLKPDYSSAQKLAEQLRTTLLQRAVKCAKEHEYRMALDSLEQILPFVRNAEVDKIQAKIEELNALVDAIRLAPVVDEVTLKLTERLAKSVPQNPQAQAWLKTLNARLGQSPSNPRFYVNDWNPGSKPSAQEIPVDLLGSFTRIPAGSEERSQKLKSNPGQFWVALGLALQGIEQAHIEVDLSSNARPSVLGVLSRPFLKKNRAAWGLDLSSSGLKAVKLSWDEKTNTAKLLEVEFIPHSKSLSHPEAEVERHDIIKQTFQQFLAKHKLDGERVIAGISGQRVLGRFFEIPPMVSKKVNDAILFEIKHQVPMDLADLHWGYHVYAPPAGEEKVADTLPRSVLLTAVREFHAKERLRQFKENGLNVEMLVPEPVALHNAIQYEFFEDKAFAHNRDGALATVDLGADCSNVVISSPNYCWFRTFGVGGDDFTRKLSQEFQLTYDQAETLKKKPWGAPRFSQLQSALEVVCRQVKGEVVRSLGTYAKTQPLHKIAQIFGIGGGIASYGLLKELRE